MNANGMNFSDMNLEGIRLEDTDISGGNFLRANLQNSRLRRVNINSADFTEANLKNIDWADIKTGINQVFKDSKSKI